MTVVFADGEPVSKRPKTSPVEHLDTEALMADRRGYKWEFKSKDCDIRKWKIHTLVSTADMSEVMKSFGVFPLAYYVREEEVYVLKQSRIVGKNSGWRQNLS